MNKVFLLLSFSVLLFSSCDSVSSEKCKKSVEKSFPKAIQIIQPSGEKFTWILIDKDSSIYYVETMAEFSTEVTKRELIIK